MNGIIVGVNQTGTARKAAERAASLAKSLGVPLHLLMSTKPRSSQHVRNGTDGFQTDWVTAANGFLDNLKLELGAPDATTSVSTDDPAKALCEKAAQIGCSIIVVGNRRVQGASRVLGSVAAHVSRHAPCDVLIAHTMSSKASEAAAHVNTVASAEVFAGLSAAQREQVGRLSTSIRIKEGKELTHEGRTGREFGVILEGGATVTIGGEVVATLGPGDHFGEMALFAAAGSDASHQSATIVADGDMMVSMMSVSEFTTLVNDFPAIGEALRKTAAERAAANA